MRRWLALVAWVIGGSLAVAGSPPPASEHGEVVAGLQAWLDGTITLEARFRQSLISGALGTGASESGRLALERPGRLRWDYLDPERKTALLLGDRTFLYLEGDRQYIRGRLQAEQALFPRLLAGSERIGSLFSSTLVATPRAGGNGSYRLRLVPRGTPGGVASVTLDLRPRSFAIERAEIIDELGNRTTYALSDVKRNAELPVGCFAFEPPPGTEVIDQP